MVVLYACRNRNGVGRGGGGNTREGVKKQEPESIVKCQGYLVLPGELKGRAR